MQQAAIALGSNRGDRAAHLRSAWAAIGALPGTRTLGLSRFHETEPVGDAGPGRFLNAAGVIETALPPRDLLDAMQAIERGAGRPGAGEPDRHGPRALDLDLLLYGDRQVDEPRLTVPHPRMHHRRFVLAPLAEVAPDLRHPALNKTVSELLSDLDRQEDGGTGG